MTIISAAPGGSGDAYARLVASLQMEFGSSEVCSLAARILEAEKPEFHWDARVEERYLGQHVSVDVGDDECGEELARIAILSFIAGCWHAGICLVNGDGCAISLLWLRSYEAREDAAETFARAR